jgi:hypothetical protein
VQTPSQNNYVAAQMKLQKKSETSKALFLVLLLGFVKPLHIAVRKGEDIFIVIFLHVVIYHSLSLKNG